MTTVDTDLTITPEQIAQARKDRLRYEGLIVTYQRKMAALDQFLSAAAILNPDVVNDDGEADKDDNSPQPDNLMGLIERLANTSRSPLAKSQMRTTLAEMGIPADRLQSYFYVAVDRLKKKGRVSVLADGRIWKAGYVEPQ